VAELDCQSLPFGDQQNCFTSTNSPVSADDATSLHFTGKERDTESENDYFGARYYSSNMGRWLNPDKPFTDQHLENPQSWNLYSYVRNNPLVAIDDNGEGTRPAQSQYINAALATDRTLTRVILASINFSPGGFEDAYNSGRLNNLDAGVGNTLRGLAGEATVLDDINKTGFWSLVEPGAASPSPSNLPGVHPDIGVMFDPIGFVLQNVANAAGGTVQFGPSVIANYMEIKSGLSASSIGTGVTQAVNTASAIKAAGLGGEGDLNIGRRCRGLELINRCPKSCICG
jgi:RHS repeat-associated protein